MKRCARPTVLHRLRNLYIGGRSRREAVDIARLCEAVAATFANRLASAGDQPADFPSSGPESIEADETQLEIVLHNLLANAIDATDPESGDRRKIEMQGEPPTGANTDDHRGRCRSRRRSADLRATVRAVRHQQVRWHGARPRHKPHAGSRARRGNHLPFEARAWAAPGFVTCCLGLRMARVHERPGIRKIPTVFVVDDDAAVRDALSLLISLKGMRAAVFASARRFPGRIRARLARLPAH